MGYHYISNTIKCPFFKNVVKTQKGQFIGIECEPPKVDLGFDTTMIIRFENSNDLNDYRDIFCKDMHETCPYYRYSKGQSD
jgi:hypothetical protein